MKYSVRCADFETAPSRSREEAARILGIIESDGYCSLPHEIVEVSDNHRRF